MNVCVERRGRSVRTWVIRRLHRSWERDFITSFVTIFKVGNRLNQKTSRVKRCNRQGQLQVRSSAPFFSSGDAVGEQNPILREQLDPEIPQDRFANLFLNRAIPSLIEAAEVSLSEPKFRETLGFCSAHDRRYHGAASFVGGRHCRFYSLLHSQHLCQTHHSQRNTRASAESWDGFRAVDRGRNHPAGFLGRFLNCCPFLPGGRRYKSSRHWQRCHRIRFSKHSAEFSCRFAVVEGRTLRVGDEIRLDPYEGTVEEIQSL